MAKTIQAKVSDEDNATFVELITELGYRSKAAAASVLVQQFLAGEVEIPEYVAPVKDEAAAEDDE
jgi:hypothetical protein